MNSVTVVNKILLFSFEFYIFRRTISFGRDYRTQIYFFSNRRIVGVDEWRVNCIELQKNAEILISNE